MSTPKETLPDVDKPEQQTFVRFFHSLDQPTQGTIRLFERDSTQKQYYTFHGEDALFAAEHVYKTTTVIKYWGGDNGLPTVSVSSAVAEAFLRDALLNKQLRIEIWTQSRSTWQLSRKASPGNLQDVEDLLFLNANLTAAPVVLAAKVNVSGENKTVGVAFADATTKEIGVSEFIDNDLYSNFESLVIQLGVKECLLPADEGSKDYELTKLKSVLERCGIVMTHVKKSDFLAKDIDQDLNRLLQGEMSAVTLPEFELKVAMSSTACLIKYLDLLQDETHFKQFSLKHHDLSQYMRLDASALAALSLMPSPNEGSNKTMSLFGLLNQCKTAQGSRLLIQWLKQPLLNLAEIRHRQDLVEIFFEDTDLRQSLQESHLKSVPDLHRLAKRFQRGLANLQDVVRLYQVVIRLPGLIACLEAHRPEDATKGGLLEETFTTPFNRFMTKLIKLQELVESTIDLDAVERHEFIIKPEFDEALQNLREKLDETRQLIDEEHQRIGAKLNMDTEKKLKLEKHSIYGYCIRVNRTDASKLRNKSEFIEYGTQKAGTYYSTVKMKDLSTASIELMESYDKRQKSLVKEVINIVVTYCPVLELLGSTIANLDVLVSFAEVSIMAPRPFVRPELAPAGQGNVVLQDARHPCLEVQDDVAFIPNDVDIIRQESDFQIITGPNMGGKSTYIRQIGVIALMAQIGCFVPCTEAKLCIFDSILARVGASDSQLKGVSTFMAEMLETATILKTATRNSLIIIDELGRGTSTYDGFGLAWAISEYIATNIKAFCLFATHFHELTALGETVPHVRNLNVAVHIEEGQTSTREITLLYKVSEGVCDQSFGIHVAEMAEFPPTVVRLAKRKAAELEDDADLAASDVSQKHAKTDVEEGTRLVEQMVRELGNISQTNDVDSMDHDALLAAKERVREKYKDQIQANPYLRDLVAGL